MDERDGTPPMVAYQMMLGAALFLTSAGGLVVEIVAGRMIAPYVGMSLYTWTAIIATVLAGLSLGHWLGGVLRPSERVRAHLLLAATLVLAAATAILALALIRLISPRLLGAGLDPVLAIVVLTAALFFLPSMFVGVVSPIVTDLALSAAPRRPARVIGRMYALGALGSILGTLAAGYVFIAWIGSIGTMLAIAALYAGLAILFLLSCGLTPVRAGSAFAAAMCLLAGAVALADGRRGLVTPCLTESAYYCIRVVDYPAPPGDAAALMVIDHMAHGINARNNPERYASSYVELTDRLLDQHRPGMTDFAAFFIGGGAFTLPRGWAHRFPEARAVVAEIDPAVTSVARDRMWLEPSENLSVLHVDARSALAGLPPETRFDVIVGDAFHDISVPAHLTTAEFAALVRRRLAPGGFYTLTAIDDLRRPMFLFSVVATLSTVFPVVEVWVDRDQLEMGGRATLLVVAKDNATAVGRLRSQVDLTRLWLRWPPERLRSDIAASGAQVLTDDHAPVDRLMFPVLGQDL